MSNSSSQPLAFKVKTTAPKLYCVRPNASIIAPGESIKISLILQGFTQPLPKDYKCKDKFLIVSLPCPDLQDPAKVSELWSLLESKYKEQLLQKKLKVNFVIDDEDESHIDDTTFANATQSAPLAGAGAAAGAAGVTASGADTTRGNETLNNVDGNGSVYHANASSEAASIAAASTVRKDVPAEELQKELDASTAKINNLSEKLDSNEASEKSTATAVEEAVSGVSVPFAVILVILALLLGWYIF